MAEEQEGKKPQTEVIGYLSLEEAQKVPGWKAYMEKAEELTKARRASEAAKNSVRKDIKEDLRLEGEIDFTVEGERVRVFKVLHRKRGRARAQSLSLSFQRRPRAAS